MLNKFKISHSTLNFSSSSYNENEMFILISLLHVNGFINDKSMFAKFKQLKSGKMIRQVNTYYSKINNQWYNYESMIEIYRDILGDMTNPKSGLAKLKFDRTNKLKAISGLPPKVFKLELNFDETLFYLNRYLNKNKNYCIDHLYHTFIKPNLSNFEFYGYILKSMFDYNFDYVSDRFKASRDDYCCEYCCGEYSDWVNYNNDRMGDETNKQIAEYILVMVNDFLNSKRPSFKGSKKELTL